MKFNVLRSLIFPWMMFFFLSVAGLITVGVTLHVEPQFHRPSLIAMLIGVVICLLFNLNTLSRAGIWIAYSLPFTMHFSARPWIVKAGVAVTLAWALYLMGQASWMPLMWQGFVVPAAFTSALFIAVWHLLGPLLRWCSRLTFGRTLLFVASLPIFATVPMMALFLGQNIFNAYRASRPEILVLATPAVEINPEETTIEPPKPPAPTTVAEKRAVNFKMIAESGKPCPEESRNIQKALDASISEDIVLAAIEALSCANMKAIIALPKLVTVMQSHPSMKVRAAAILAMPRYGTENVAKVSYLLVKRVSSQQPPEMIEAAATVLARLPEEERKGTVSRLTALLNETATSELAGRMLNEKLKRPDLVAEFVAAHLTETGAGRERAIAMVCSLPPEQLSLAEEHIGEIVAAVKTGAEDDPALKALRCLGPSGLQALHRELVEPRRLKKAVTARALSTLDTQDKPEMLETMADCARDGDDQVRRWCGETLGRMGVAALPKIMDLLKSGDTTLSTTGKRALDHLDDPAAKDELKRIRADNSGWMANKHKVEIARAVDKALVKIDETSEPAPAESARE